MLWLLLLLPSVFYSPDISYSLDQYHISLLRALLLALLIYEGFRDPVWLNRLFQWLAWLALGMVLVFIYQIGVQLLNHGIGSVANWGLYRGFGDVLVLLLPMAYLAARNTSDWRKPLFWLVAMLMISLAFATGSRGVLGAAVVAFALLGVCERNIKAFLMLLIALGVGFVLFRLVFIPEVVAQRVASGVQSSGRVETVWLPYIDVWMRDAPWLGFGFGPEHFDTHFQAIVAQQFDPAVQVHRSGAHNQLLEIAVQTGLIGAVLTLLTWAGQLWHQIRASSRALRMGDLGGYAVLAALIGHFGVRGFIDTVNWVSIGLLVGLAAAVSHVQRSRDCLGKR